MTRQAVVTAAKDALGGPLPVRMVCPVCLGGSDHEECLVVWDGDDGNVYATCHRSRCEIGTVLVDGSLRVRAIAAGEFKDKPEHLTSPKQYKQGVRLTGNGKAWLMYKADLPDRYHDVYVMSYGAGANECVYFPMLDPDAKQRGCILKPISPDTTLPKSLTYKDDGYDGMSWYLPVDHLIKREVVLVEDCLSALVLLAQGVCAISLNGTMLNPERIETISKYKSCIHICLDADASRKAVRYALRYRNRFKLKVTRLEKDFKDMGIQEVQFVLQGMGLL